MRRLAPLFLIALAACGSDSRVIVAAGTTLVDSGVLGLVVAEFESDSDIEVSVVDTSSLRVLELGRRGGAHVLLTHHPQAEAAFLEEGVVVDSAPLMASRFLLLAPPPIASQLEGSTLAEALSSTASRGLEFVARRDGSGTAAFEQAAWLQAGLDPTGWPWYSSTGLGMGETLLVANDRSALTIAEEGAFRSAEDAVDLTPVDLIGDYPNPYRITLVGNDGDAREFYEWLLSPRGGEAIEKAGRDLFGEAVYQAVSR